MTAADIERLYMLRRDLLRLRNAAGAAGRGLPPADRRRPAADPPGDARRYFRDVTDHIRTVQEKIDNLREVLAFAFETSLLMGQSQATAITKKLASWAAILAVPTAVAGIYGMNFEYMPELASRYGYPTVVARASRRSAACSTGASARTAGSRRAAGSSRNFALGLSPSLGCRVPPRRQLPRGESGDSPMR